MSLPANMKYIDHDRGGPASCMQVKHGDLPQLKSGEVLIEVAYAGVNRPDILQRLGAYPPPAGASPILGLEVAGKIVALGETISAKVQSKGYRGADDDANKDSRMKAPWCQKAPK